MIDKSQADTNFPVYEWNEWVRSLILSSFSWGFSILQVPAGALADRNGGKKVILLSLLLAALSSLLIPLGASVGGWGFVCACRFVQGLSQGMFEPALNVVYAKWVPVAERNKIVLMANSGEVLGSVIGMSASGWLTASAVGWPGTFYVFGVLGLVVATLVYFLMSDSPEKDPRITPEERDYIEQSLGTTQRSTGKLAIPWRALLSSRAVWAKTAGSIGFYWGYWTLIVQTPTYMDYVLGFRISSSGMLSALPFLTFFLLIFVFGYIADFINNRKLLSVRNSRKLFQAIATSISGAGLVAFCYTTNATLATALLCMSVGGLGSMFVGSCINHLDFAPNFAGIVYGISNSIANCVSPIAQFVVAGIVTDETSVYQWRIVFFIAAGIYLATGIFFLVFAEGEVQWWNDPPQISNNESTEDIETDNCPNGTPL